MEPTTITTIFMILFAIFVTSWAIYCWFSDWQPVVRRYLSPEESWRPRSKRRYGGCGRPLRTTSEATDTSDLTASTLTFHARHV